jgi:PAS domain S-box-containing protein
MNEEQFLQHFQEIHVQMAALHKYRMQLPQEQQKQMAEILERIVTSLESLQLIYEEMQTSLEASTVIEEELIQQSEQAVAERQHYYELFQFAPDAYLLTDTNGLILEANAYARKLLNIPQNYLIRKPLIVFVAQEDRKAFRSYLNQLSQIEAVQDWELTLCPRDGKPFAAVMKVTLARDVSGEITALQIVIQDISQYKQASAQPLQLIQQQQDEVTGDATLSKSGIDFPIFHSPLLPSLPRSLDGLQVLIVDDEADAREFISTVLESYGIRVTAVATTAAALEALEKFRPDVLVSDIRMPDDNGYNLMGKIRQLETEKGWHIPVAALTAYLAEDREKALAAGFASHLHKLAQPTELVAMIARLAGRV